MASRRSRRLKGMSVDEIDPALTKIKEEIVEDESLDIAEHPFFEVMIKKEEDDAVPVVDESEELVHLNDDVDEDEIYGDYSCQKCSVTFASWNSLKAHMKSAHEAIECFKCRLCTKVYNNVEAFTLHVGAEHGGERDELVKDCLETLTLYRVSRGTSLYTRIKRKYGLTRPSQCNADSTAVTLSCSQCAYKTGNKSALARHVATHVTNVSYKCETCGRKFRVRRDLTFHVRYSHRDQTCICDVCGKICANNRVLDGHRKFVHFEGKFECKFCHRLLISQENLDTHIMRQHMEEKPKTQTVGNYVCETCGKVFARADKLQRHKLMHTGDKTFVCEACGKVFARSDRLRRHKLVHSGEKPFVCAICKESFARKNSLTQHLLLHTGAKPYVCDICGKAFAQKPGLTGHRRSHPGVHPPLPPVYIGPILNDVLRQCEQ